MLGKILQNCVVYMYNNDMMICDHWLEEKFNTTSTSSSSSSVGKTITTITITTTINVLLVPSGNNSITSSRTTSTTYMNKSTDFNKKNVWNLNY